MNRFPRRHLTAALAGGAALAVVATGCGSSSTTTSSGSGKPHITIAAANFAENEVLAYVYGDALKADGFSTTVKSPAGTRETIEPALDSGAVDMTPEYAGSLLSYLDPSVGTLTVSGTVSALSPIVAKKGLVLGSVSQASDADAVAVTAANASKYHLSSIADLKKIAPSWTFGGPPECATRITCVTGMVKYYGVKFKSFKSLDEDGPLTVSALQNGDVQAARIFSSDTSVAQDHFKVLSDPKDFQGAGNIIPVIRKVKATSETVKILDQVSSALTTADLVQFNIDVEVNHQDPSAVAAAFVKAHKLG